MKIAIFGSAFNPAHYGHEAIVRHVLKTGIADNVVLAISIDHPFQKELLPFQIRHEFAATLATKTHAQVLVDDKHCGRTVPLIEDLKKSDPDTEWMYIIGQDNADDIDNFYESEKIISGDCCPFIVVPRGSSPTLRNSAWYASNPHIFLNDFQPMDICSTDLRKAFKSMDADSWRIFTHYVDSLEKELLPL